MNFASERSESEPEQQTNAANLNIKFVRLIYVNEF